MKLILSFFVLISTAAAQWVVHDPGNTAVNAAVQAGQAANHLEVMRQWAEQLERLNRQLRELEAQLAVQQRIRDVMGDPSAAGLGLVLRDLGTGELARTYGETLAEARRLANALDSLRRTSDGIYRQLDDRTALGRPFARNEQLYRRYAAVERQADTFAEVQAQTETRIRRLQEEFARTLESLRSAGTQAEVDKLSAKLAALDAQLAQLATRRRDEADKLTALQVLNQNQAAKEQQDLLEKQLAEERQSLGVIARWQESFRVEPTKFSRP